jgi:hypothetical protein
VNNIVRVGRGLRNGQLVESRAVLKKHEELRGSSHMMFEPACGKFRDEVIAAALPVSSGELAR